MKRSILALIGAIALIVSCEKKEQEVPVSSVSMSQATAEMVVGETITLSATVLPADATDKTVNWASSNQSVATVAGGKVTAVSEGQSTITASAGGKSATCTVTVRKKTIDVASVELNKTELALTEGDSETLVATVKPDDATDKTVTWSTSDATIATVENGKVTAIKDGEATVTAKAGEKSATCKVTVSKKVIPVSEVTLDHETLELVEGDEATLVATVKPDDATDKTVTWSTSDATVATVENGKVTAVKEGEATITAKAGEKEATCKVVVSKKVIPVTSVELNKTTLELIEEESETLTATVKPDDATDKTVTWSTSDATVATVENGKVTAVKEGEATITAKAGEKEDMCRVTVKKNPQNEPIVFADENIKTKLVAAFDANGDGELSYGEAAAVKDSQQFKSAFEGSVSYSSFDEFQFFSGITSIPESMFEKWLIESIIMPNSVTEVGTKAFNECAILKNIVFSNNLKSISNMAFKDCISLETITLPETLGSINFQAFYGCTSLKTIVIPQNVKGIGPEAFFGCSNMTSISLPSGLKWLQYGALSRCSSLKSVTLPESLDLIDSYMFSHDSSLETVNMPETIKRINYSAFEKCTSLKNIVMPSSVTEIEYRLFEDCTNLVSVTLSANLAGKLPWKTFRNCKQLEKIVIPEAITEIESEVFVNCSALTEITIPKNVKKIGPSILMNCTSLQRVIVLSKTVPQCTPSSSSKWGAFNNTNCPILVPAESVEEYKNAPYWSEYSDRIQAIGTPQAVDLGLSVKWASFNIGATKPEEYGDYYAWGETESYYNSISPIEWKSGKSGYNIESYKWCKGGYYTLTKYCPSNKTDYWGGDGSPDGMTQLEAKDDVAHVILGGGWRMPSDEEWTELLENCTWIWTTMNSVNGFLFTSSKNGNSIFLPATGYWNSTLLLYADSAGCYWSSSLCSDIPHNAWYISCNMGKVVRANTERSNGFSIRAVRE